MSDLKSTVEQIASGVASGIATGLASEGTDSHSGNRIVIPVVVVLVNSGVVQLRPEVETESE